MSNSACAISPRRARSTSIASAISSPRRRATRSICARSRSATIIRSCCAPDASRTSHALGFKLASEEDLDRAAAWFARRDLPTSFPEVPFQRRTLRTADSCGMPLEFYAGMEQAECMLQRYAAYQGARIQRIDHINCFTPDVQAELRFLHRPRLPPDRIHRDRRPRSEALGGVAAPQGQRARPRLHQRARPAPAPYRRMDRERARHPAHLRRDGDLGLPRQHGARARPPRHLQRLLSLCARPRRPPRRAVHQRLSHRRSRPRADPLVAARSAAPDPVGPSGAEIVVRGGLAVCRRPGARAGARGAADRGRG